MNISCLRPHHTNRRRNNNNNNNDGETTTATVTATATATISTTTRRRTMSQSLLCIIYATQVLSCLCFFSSMIPTVDATISFIESGKTFHSKMDRHLGQPLLRGYEYMGRLQYVADNPTLCPGEYPNQNFSIVTPMDGLPGACVRIIVLLYYYCNVLYCTTVPVYTSVVANLIIFLLARSSSNE